MDKGKIKRNYKTLKSLLDRKCKMMIVVKSNAYGHFLIDFAHEAVSLGADMLGVDSIVEAVALRKQGIKIPILVLGFTIPQNIDLATKHDITLTVSSLFSLKKIISGKQKGLIKVHIKVDTGMHRQGFFSSQADAVVKLIEKREKKISIDGVYTHFAEAKNPAFPTSTMKQLSEFDKWKEIFSRTFPKIIYHAAASAGMLLYPKSHLDMVRVGIAIYGLWPSKEVEGALSNSNIKLLPVLSWKTIISEIKFLDKGDKIGYNFAERLNRKTKVAICPVGYWHGYPLNLSSIGNVLVRGERAKILGRISMDMMAIDISDIPGAREMDEVVLIGFEGGQEISVQSLAELSDTSSYEFITRINPLIKRFFV